MATVVIVTEADRNRKGMTYKVEMPDWVFETWWTENKTLRELKSTEWGFLQRGTYSGANTSFTILRDGKPMEIHLFRMTENQLTFVLGDVDYNYPEETGGKVGRPEKRVLVCTTSKERRTGAMTARHVKY